MRHWGGPKAAWNANWAARHLKNKGAHEVLGVTWAKLLQHGVCVFERGGDAGVDHLHCEGLLFTVVPPRATLDRGPHALEGFIFCLPDELCASGSWLCLPQAWLDFDLRPILKLHRRSDQQARALHRGSTMIVANSLSLVAKQLVSAAPPRHYLHPSASYLHPICILSGPIAMA